MTTLYLPTPIRDMAHAEGMPVGTIVFDSEDLGPWRMATDGTYRGAAGEAVGTFFLTGGTALVPVEADDETRVDPQEFEQIGNLIKFADSGLRPLVPSELRRPPRHQRRNVTPWTPVEDA